MQKDDLELAKAGVEGAVAGALQPVHDLIRWLAGPAAKELGATVGDHVRVYRLERAIRLAERVKTMIVEAGFDPRPIDLQVLLPAFEHASLEDDLGGHPNAAINRHLKSGH